MDTGAWGDDPVIAIVDRMTAAYEAAAAAGTVPRGQADQLNLLMEKLGADNQLAATLLEFVTAVLVCCDEDTVMVTSADAPSTWRM